MRRLLSLEDRFELASCLRAGWTQSAIAAHIGRSRSVVSREIRRNSSADRGYLPVAAETMASERRCRPQRRAIDTDVVLKQRVVHDLRKSCTPRQIAGRLRQEASGMDMIEGSIPVGGSRVSHEAIYRWIYALPKGELADLGIMLRSKRTARKKRKDPRQRYARIVGMTSIDARDPAVADRRVPGHWEGDLIIGAGGKSAAITLVERTTRFVMILALPDGKTADGVADVLIEKISGLPELVRKSLTWDQGTEMGRHAAVTLATELPIYFAHPHSPWERPTNENTNGLIREYLPKGTEITAHQPYLTAIAEELNNRPRQVLGFHTPQEAFQQLLLNNVATTT